MTSNLNNPDWRGKVGLILPSANTVTEPLFYALAPQGVSFHSSRTFITGTGVEDIMAMEKEKGKAVRELATARLGCIIDCCTASGVRRGLEADKAFCSGIEQDTGIRATSTLQAVVEALEVLELRRLVIAGPYPEEMDELEESFFEKNGFSVLNIQGLGIEEGWRMAQVSPREIYHLCTDAWDTRAEGLFISCMNLNPMPVIQALELDLKVPVVSSNSATLWKILQIIGVEEPVWGYGRLLSDYMSVKCGD